MTAEKKVSMSAAGAPAQLGILGGTAIKPVERHGWDAIRNFIYNKDTGEFITRTPKSWGLICLFYLIYYSCLAAFWAANMVLFLKIQIDDKTPTWTLENSRIGTNPGMGYRPINADSNIDSSIFRLKWDNQKGMDEAGDGENLFTIGWAKRLEIFLEEYTKAGDPLIESLGECGKAPYGYKANGEAAQIQPCVMLKMNRIYGKTFEAFTAAEIDAYNDNVEDARNRMPPGAAAKLKASPTKVIVNCEGEWPLDKEVLEANPLTYFPADQGLPFEPVYTNQPDYRSPLVAVQMPSTLPKGQLIHIECRLWFKGVVHSRKEKMAMTRFEFLLDDNNE
jgi:sodium/potassium-transporting ATPase subunit beta